MDTRDQFTASDTTSDSAGTGGNGADQYGSSYAGTTTDDVRQKAGEAIDQAKVKAGEVVGQVQEQAKSQLATQKDRVADTMDSVSQALTQTGQQLRNSDGASPIAQYADKAATQIEEFATYLREHDPDDIVSRVEDLARRQPAVFLGGAVLLGMVGARFLRSSQRRADQMQYHDDVRSGRTYAGSGYSGSNYGTSSYSGRTGRSASYYGSQGYASGYDSEADGASMGMSTGTSSGTGWTEGKGTNDPYETDALPTYTTDAGTTTRGDTGG